MRAMVFHQTGGPEVVRLEKDWPDPAPVPGRKADKIHRRLWRDQV